MHKSELGDEDIAIQLMDSDPTPVEFFVIMIILSFLQLSLINIL